VRGAGAAFAALAILVGTPAHAAAQEPSRQVFLCLVDGVSYEDALTEPLLASIRGGGGIGLMTTLRGEERGAAAYLSIGAGVTAEALPAEVAATPDDGGLRVDVDAFADESGDGTAGLLASQLEAAGRTVGYLDLGGASPHPAMLVAMDRTGRIPVAFRNEFPVLGRLSGAVLGSRAAPVLERADLVVSPGLESLRFALQASRAEQVLILVVVPSASAEMRARGDLVTPVVLARGAREDVLGSDAPAVGLTSETTRREGIVSNLDVAPTILEFLDVPIPGHMAGSSIGVVGEPPTALHKRYLEYRRTGPAVGVVSLMVAIASLVAGLVVLAVRRTRGLAEVVSVWVLGSVAVLVALQPASLLPTFDLPLVAGTVIVVAALVTWAGLRAGRGDPVAPVAVVAGIGLAVEALDAMLGWPTGLTPLLSGGALEGVRFYGLGNSYAGIVLGGAVLVAARLNLRVGVAFIATAALFAGMPYVGGDLGGGLTLLAAATLWYGLRAPGPRRWVLAAAIGLVLAALLVVAYRLLPEGAPHIARASAEGLGGLVGSLFERLADNLRATARVPAAWLALIGVPVWLVVAWRRLGPFRALLEQNGAWRDAVVTLALGGMIGYVLNDTFGMTAVAFVFVSAAMVYPALRWKAA
jgi:hypothetical protein